MFSNFKDAFIRRPQFTIKPPDSVLKTISKGLPNGLRYVHDHDGFCRLESDEGSINLKIKDFAIVGLEKEQYQGIPIDRILDYSYNSQRRIKVLPDEDNCYVINESKIKCSDIIIAPLKNIEFIDGHFYISPPPFPDPFPLMLSGNKYSLTVMVQRQPVDSYIEVKFQSVGCSAIEVMYTVNTETHAMQFSIKTNFVNKAADVLASKEIFNAFVAGKGMIGGNRIEPLSADSALAVTGETIEFWRKVVSLEQVLNITFDVKQEIPIDNVEKINKLFRSLVEKLPYKTYRKQSITQLETIKGGVDINAIIGQEVVLVHSEKCNVNLFNADLELYAITEVFDGVVAEATPIDDPSNRFSIKLVSANGKQMYSSTQYFISEKDMDTVLNDQKHVEIFQNATELEEV